MHFCCAPNLLTELPFLYPKAIHPSKWLCKPFDLSPAKFAPCMSIKLLFGTFLTLYSVFLNDGEYLSDTSYSPCGIQLIDGVFF